ncbi:MAG: hypothetical protein WCX17_02465 [Parcubacteria group bacterium]|jgi:hypothetical protein
MEDEKDNNEEIKLLAEPQKIESGKKDFYVELVLFLILGALIGITVKTEANKRITIGYNDYKMKTGIQQYSINKLQADLLKKQSEAASNSQDSAQNSAEGASCTNNQ